jgi:hypothetical protein
MFLDECSFCPNCNAAQLKKIIEFARYDYPCSRCGMATISQFYSIDSKHHLDLLDGNVAQPSNALPIPPKSN